MQLSGDWLLHIQKVHKRLFNNKQQNFNNWNVRISEHFVITPEMRQIHCSITDWWNSFC